MKFVELNKKEFEQAKIPGRSFLQSKEMYQRYLGLGREVYFLGVKSEAGEVLALGMATMRKWHFGWKILRVPGGWVMNYGVEDTKKILEVLTEGVKKFAKQKRVILMEISPNLELKSRDIEGGIVPGVDNAEIKAILEELGYRYLGEREQIKWMFKLGLGGETAQSIWDGFRQSHRRMLRKAEKAGLKVVIATKEQKTEFMKLMQETGQRQGFVAQNQEYFESMQSAFGNKVKLMAVETPEGKMAAVGMFIEEPEEVIYLYGGAKKELMNLGGSYLLQWVMIQEAIRLGKNKYNFYGVRPTEGDGVYQFKQGFRGRVVELLGTFGLPIGVVGKIYVKFLPIREYGEIR